MSIKGFFSNFWTKELKVGNPQIASFKEDQHYASLSQHGDGVYGLRTTPKGVGLVASTQAIDAADPSSILSKDALPITGHSLRVGDVIRFTSGTQANEEAQVVVASDPNWVVVIGLSAAPALGDTFDHLRPISQTFDLNGNPSVALANKTVVDRLDNEIEFPTGARAIPDSGSAPLLIVASTALPISEIQMIHDMGEPTNLYSDAAGTVFLCHLPLTPDEKVQIVIPAGTALYIRAAKAAAIDDATSFYEMNLIG